MSIVLGTTKLHGPKDGYSTICWLEDEARNLGVHCVASKGHGKSRFIGKMLCFGDAGRVPIVVFDAGDVTDYLIEVAIAFGGEIKNDVLSRIRYVDLSGLNGYVTPVPLYYRYGGGEGIHS